MQAGGESATIVVARKHGGWRDRARSYVIVVDGQPVTKIKHGQRIELPVPGGPHHLQLKISWCTSPAIAFDRSRVRWSSSSASPAVPPSAGLRDVVGQPGQYIKLTRQPRQR